MGRVRKEKEKEQKKGRERKVGKRRNKERRAVVQKARRECRAPAALLARQTDPGAIAGP